jgi:hypothetical protein
MKHAEAERQVSFQFPLLPSAVVFRIDGIFDSICQVQLVLLNDIVQLFQCLRDTLLATSSRVGGFVNKSEDGDIINYTYWNSIGQSRPLEVAN